MTRTDKSEYEDSVLPLKCGNITVSHWNTVMLDVFKKASSKFKPAALEHLTKSDQDEASINAVGVSMATNLTLLDYWKHLFSTRAKAMLHPA